MPSHRQQEAGGDVVPTPRRSDRLRLQREAAAESAAIQALRVAAETTPTNSSTIATHSRVINAPRRRPMKQRRLASVDVARIRQAAAEALGMLGPSGGQQTLGNSIGDGPRSPPPGDAAPVTGSVVNTSSQSRTATFSLGAPETWASLVSFTVVASTPNIIPPPPTGAESRAVMGRLRRELRDFQQGPQEGCTIEVVNDNMFHWRASIPGPPDTPYAGGQFHLDVHFGQNYPFSPPKIFFLTKIYHCNIAANGYICLDILGREWSPALSVAKVLLSIISLLADPNPDDPLEPSIASVFKWQRNQHDVMASSWTSLYAKPGQNPPIPEDE